MTSLGVQPPLIGITTGGRRMMGNFSLAAVYVDAVRKAGGRAILLPPSEPDPSFILELVDGLVFSGGGDIDPDAYNGSPHPRIYNIDSERDAFELTLARQLLNSNIPVLGICRGLEVLMVASGGDLVAHLPDEFGEAIAHRVDQLQPIEHQVEILPETHLAKLIGVKDITVVSWHHQATRTVPEGWRVAASAPDTVIEALEHEHHPWALALQWHPELSLNDRLQQRIFSAFIEAAQNRATE
ncbi:MAG: gamma-glutamyl-gamma-aminobutyrate hydrolase family protein [Rhizonema sp. NSF051]|nr:gamma-glutamyl-gamma-aminobutyrate hydrolase family protein [Rhizonema sp. NSF051]